LVSYNVTARLSIVVASELFKKNLCKSLRFTVLNSLIFEILLVFRRPSRYILIDRSAWVQGSYIKMAAFATSVQKIITDIAEKPHPPTQKVLLKKTSKNKKPPSCL
jgi:hypothetical protein